MKAKLVKIDEQYFLYDVDDNLVATTENSPYKRLSIKNCQAIECGYDLDELAKSVPHTCRNDEDWYKCRAGFIEGFQKALELMGDKKFSENDVRKAVQLAIIKDTDPKTIKTFKNSEDDIIQSLQKTEFEVEVEMRSKDIDELRELNESFLNNTNLYVPKLDADGRWILRRN